MALYLSGLLAYFTCNGVIINANDISVCILMSYTCKYATVHSYQSYSAHNSLTAFNWLLNSDNI